MKLYRIMNNPSLISETEVYVHNGEVYCKDFGVYVHQGNLLLKAEKVICASQISEELIQMYARRD
jgi:hypothetical protein